MTNDLPAVSAWTSADQASAAWSRSGDLPPYLSMRYEKRHNDAGTWEMVLPWGAKAAAIGTGTAFTFDWRGARMTGLTTKHEVALNEDGRRVLNLSGLDALSYLGWTLAYPQPLQPITSQDPSLPSDPPPTIDTAENAVRHIVQTNVVARRALGLLVPASTGLGTTVRIRPAFDDLLDLATEKATRGGIGITVGLVDVPNTASANLTYSAYLPANKGMRVRFGEDQPGGLRSWTVTQNAPTGNRAVVAGVAGSTHEYRVVSRPTGGWVAVREFFVQGPQSYNAAELDQAADEALDPGAATVIVQVQPGETANLQAFRDYTAGDVGTVVLPTGLTLTDTIRAVEVSVDESGPTVKTTFGDPDGIDNELASQVRDNRRKTQQTQRRT